MPTSEPILKIFHIHVTPTSKKLLTCTEPSSKNIHASTDNAGQIMKLIWCKLVGQFESCLFISNIAVHLSNVISDTIRKANGTGDNILANIILFFPFSYNRSHFANPSGVYPYNLFFANHICCYMQTVWKKIRPGLLPGLIYFQTV